MNVVKGERGCESSIVLVSRLLSRYRITISLHSCLFPVLLNLSSESEISWFIFLPAIHSLTHSPVFNHHYHYLHIYIPFISNNHSDSIEGTKEAILCRRGDGHSIDERRA